jgi:ATP-dependent RNA helicase DDX5/DBP2
MYLLTFAAAIHGDKQQNERDWVLNEFKTGKSPIMVATDVASRGIGMIANPPTPPPLPELLLRVNCQCALLRSSRALAAFAPMTSSMA